MERASADLRTAYGTAALSLSDEDTWEMDERIDVLRDATDSGLQLILRDRKHGRDRIGSRPCSACSVRYTLRESSVPGRSLRRSLRQKDRGDER